MLPNQNKLKSSRQILFLYSRLGSFYISDEFKWGRYGTRGSYQHAARLPFPYQLSYS